MKPQKETFADITAEFIGKPYSENGIGPDSFGCIGFCYAFLKRAGKAIDESAWEFDGLTLGNFMEKWKQDHSIDRLLIPAFDRIGTEIPVKRKLAGDLMILCSKADGSFSPAIYGGNNNFMASYADLGVRVFTMNNGSLEIVKVRRL